MEYKFNFCWDFPTAINTFCYNYYHYHLLEPKNFKYRLKFYNDLKEQGFSSIYFLCNENDNWVVKLAKPGERFDSTVSEEDLSELDKYYRENIEITEVPEKDKNMTFKTTEDRRNRIKKFAKENGYHSASEFIEDAVLAAMGESLPVFDLKKRK